MKKAIRILFKSILILIVSVFLLLLIIPIFFKNTIKEKVVEQVNKSIEATMSFDDYSLSLIRNFPNLSFRLENVELKGVDKFEGQTLAGFDSFVFVFDLSSLTGNTGYTVKSLILDRPVANAIVLQDGSANWDIMKETESRPELEEEEELKAKEGKELSVNLEQIEIRKAAVSYTDYSSGIRAGFGSLDLKISGNFSESLTLLLIDLLVEDIDVYMEGDRYVNSAVLKGNLDIEADMENQVFTLNNNSFSLNDLRMYVDGKVSVTEDVIETNIKFATGETQFKSLLSLVPAFFMSGYNDLETKGTIKMDVTVAGTYNSATGQLPDVGLGLTVSEGTVWFGGNPELMSDLNINTSLKVNSGRITGNTDVKVSMIDLGRVLSMMPADTIDIEETDTANMEMKLIEVPGNIDFELNATIDHFLFNSLDASELQSHILVRDRKLMIDGTGLKTLGGHIGLSALYNTEDLANPFMNASIEANNIGIKDAYDGFVTVQKLAPIAEGMDGSASVQFGFESKLQQDMMPDLNSVNGLGRLRSEEVQLVNSSLFKKFSGVLNIDDKISNTFKDVDVQFRIENGRVYFNDFDTELGNIGLTIGGDHGLDQTINYLVSSAIPASELPSSLNTLVSGLAAQAKIFGLEYTPPEVYNVNVGIEGTVKDPKFIPSLGKPGKDAGSTVKESVRVAVDKKVEEVKETVKEEISRQSQKLLEEAEKQAELIKGEAAKAAQLIRDEASANAQKLIDEADSKGPLAKIAAKKAADVAIQEGNKKAAKLEEEAAIRADKILEEARKKVEKEA